MKPRMYKNNSKAAACSAEIAGSVSDLFCFVVFGASARLLVGKSPDNRSRWSSGPDAQSSSRASMRDVDGDYTVALQRAVIHSGSHLCPLFHQSSVRNISRRSQTF